MKNRQYYIKLNNKGQALIELAVVVILVMIVFMFIFDFGRAIQAKNTLTHLTREGANLASRGLLPGTEAQQYQDIMNALGYTSQPLTMRADGVIYITRIEGASSTNLIRAQALWTASTMSSKPASKLGSTINAVAQNVGLTLGNGQTAYVVEAFYNYKSILLGNSRNFQFYSKSIF